MPILLNETEKTIELTGACSVEEAEQLKSWLLMNPGFLIQSEACEYMHTAVIQCLIAAQPTWKTWPKPPHLRKALQTIFAHKAEGSLEKLA